MKRRRFRDPDSPTNPTSSAQGTAARLAMFAPPQFLEGEDAAAFDELRARVCAAVKPVDIIEEMFIADVVSLQWEVLRWRRLTWSLIRARQLEALQGFLAGQLDDDLYSEHLVDHLAEFLQDKLPKDQAHSAQGLAEKYARKSERCWQGQ